jgi:hypothetical protein
MEAGNQRGAETAGGDGIQAARRQARQLREEARRLVDQASDDGAELRAAAVSESARLREQAAAEAEAIRRQTDRLRDALAQLDAPSSLEAAERDALTARVQQLRALVEGSLEAG